MNIFLIDADNLNSGDWIDEAFRVLQETEGTLPVRRAYGSSENLKSLSDSLRAWAVRPFVNLALTKNTTDMALAVDAMELACQMPAPQLIVIGSGDADFTPLVVRLRERGIRMVCVSERSKMGREAVPAYDRVILVGPVLQSPDATMPVAGAAAARKTARKTAVKKATTRPAATKKLPAIKAPAKRATAKTAARGKTALEPAAPEMAAASPPVSDSLAPQTSSGGPHQAPVLDVAAILAAAPGLQSGQPQPLNGVTRALRDKLLLGKNAASPRLLRNFPNDFELLPAGKPNSVRYRWPSQMP